MAIDFTFSPELIALRERVRMFMEDVVAPAEPALGREDADPKVRRAALFALRSQARGAGLWLPHMNQQWGGMGLRQVELAIVQSEAAKTTYGPWVLNCQAPDEGNMHSLAHWGTEDQQKRYLRPLCEGRTASCFAMTEPETAGSDPTLLKTRAALDGDSWILNGHKWFITNARRARFAVVIARTEDTPEVPQAANSAFLVDVPTEGWNHVRDVQTMHGRSGFGHGEIVLENVRVPAENLLGGLGNGHRLGQYRLGPARLAHCMRWIAQAETALTLMVQRAQGRYAHGSLLSDKQAIQWMIADSATELYQSKLMVLHAAYKIDRGEDFSAEVSMTKNFIANALGRIVDRAIQVHGALGYSTDTPLAGMYQNARWARLADGADEVHQMRTAERVLEAIEKTGSPRAAIGALPI